MAEPFDSSFFQLLHADFTDVDVMCAAVRGWDLDFQPLGHASGEQSVGQIVQSTSGGIHFAHARFSVGLEQRGAPPPGCVTFVVLEDTLRRLWWRNHDVDSQTVLVFPVGSELHSLSGSDFGNHTVSVTEQFVEEVCAAHEIRQPVRQSMPEVFRPPAPIVSSLRTSLRLLMGRTAIPTASETKAIAEILVRSWIQSTLEFSPKRPTVRARERAIHKALERMEHSDWADLTSRELCNHTGVSERTLQYVFRDRFGLTPVAFFKARRLAAVRSVLQRYDEVGETVGDVAAQFGFWHSGQFAADYWRAFGELPSATLCRSMAADGLSGPGHQLSWVEAAE